MASAELTDEVIDSLVDLDSAIEWMNKLNLDSDEVEELSDAQHELRKYRAKASKRKSKRGGEIPNDVYKITAENVSHPELFSVML